MSKSSFDTCDVSPVCSSKVETTPRRPRNKASRSDRGIDVHTICSTPHSHHSPRGRFSNSPSSSFPYSQDNCPDVVWDFSSPKLPQGAKKKELKLTIQELLENLNQCQVPECGNQSAPYVKLLESWMSNQSLKTTEKKIQKIPNKEKKKRSRQVVEELKKFLESISAGAKKETTPVSTPRQNNPSSSQLKGRRTPKLNISAEAFIDGAENDSTDELWGDTDNSFIVRATQELDNISANANHNNLDLVSTIPETDPSVTNNVTPGSVTIDMEKYSDLLEQLSNVDWDSDIDTDEWDNGFLVEDDALSLIPDEVLGGDTVDSSKKASEVDSGVNTQSENTVSLDNQSGNPRQAVSSAELFNSFEDDSFEDEFLFCQPEVLSQIDEVENMLSQAPKCTPEEIKKKKDEALKRRLRSRCPKKS